LGLQCFTLGLRDSFFTQAFGVGKISRLFPSGSTGDFQMTEVSLLDVQARWAYSEILDSSFSRFYDGGRDIAALRAKRSRGFPFDGLTPDERYSLAFQCAAVRQGMVRYLVGIKSFVEGRLTRSQLGNLSVPPIVWPESRGIDVVSFRTYVSTQSAAPADPRKVDSGPREYVFPADPLIIGHAYSEPYLLDGYHRAVSFWRQRPAEGTIAAYIPRGIEGARPLLFRSM
jgi:hypothetical protein